MSVTLIDGNSELPIFSQMYSDGTAMIKNPQVFQDWDSILVQCEDMMEFVNAMFLVDAISSLGYRVGDLILPYIPGARQDRVNPDGDVLFTIDSVARMINERDFNRVSVVDPHSSVSGFFINRMVQHPLPSLYAKLWQGYTGVIAPDAGAKLRAQTAALTLSKPLVYGSKHRDPATGKLTGFAVDTLKPGGHYIVIDDICDGGGTFIGLAQKIQEQGAYADLFVTHGIFSKGTDALKKYYQNIYTTDSRNIYSKTNLLKIPIVRDMI